jgi:hypothetical protein
MKIGILLAAGLTLCSCTDISREKAPAPERPPAPAARSALKRLESYVIKGLTFTYFQIPAGLDQEKLIAAAQELHDREPKATLILVDDTAQLQEYIAYAKEFSQGHTEAPFPLEWAKQHVIANVQKFMSGKYKLCRGMMPADEIADLK